MKRTNKWWSENQEHWVNGEATSLFVLVTMEVAWMEQTQNLFITHTTDGRTLPDH